MGYVKRRDMKKVGDVRRVGRSGRPAQSTLAMAIAALAAMASAGLALPKRGRGGEGSHAGGKYPEQHLQYLKGAWRGDGVRSTLATKEARSLRRLEHRRTVAKVVAEREFLGQNAEVLRHDAKTAEFVRRFQRARRSPYTPRWMGGVLVSAAPGINRMNRKRRRAAARVVGVYADDVETAERRFLDAEIVR